MIEIVVSDKLVVYMTVIFSLGMVFTSHSSPINQSRDSPSKHSRRDVHSCGTSQIIQSKTDLDKLRSQAASMKKPKYYVRPNYVMPPFNRFNFSKLGCKRYDLECTCTDRGVGSVWPVKGGIESIQGGQPTPEHGLPWMMYIKDEHGGICAGFVMDYRFGITAGHCLKDTKYINITLGLHDLTKETQENAQTFTVQAHNFHIHPNMSTKFGSRRADVGLIQLSLAFRSIIFTFHRNIAPACLSKVPPPVSKIRRLQCFGAGWGEVSSQRHQIPAKLQWKRLTIVQVRPPQIYVLTLRGHDPHLLSGLCVGDSGSPLMCQDIDGVTRVYGIHNAGPPDCDSRENPATYITLSDYLPWIYKTRDEAIANSPFLWNQSSVQFEDFKWTPAMTLAQFFRDETS